MYSRFYIIKISKKLYYKKIIQRSIRTDVIGKSNHLTKCSNSFVLNIFRGLVAEKHVFTYPDILTYNRINSVQALVVSLEKLLKEVNDPIRNESKGRVDPNVITQLWDMGLFGALISKEMGGLGLNNTQYTRVLQTVGEHDLSIGVILRAHQVNGLQGIVMFGTHEQKAKYLPRATNGQYAAFCLKEPAVGSDYSSVKTTATLSRDKSHYIINGSKMFITNGDVSEIMIVFAQTQVESGPAKPTSLTAFIVERSFGGITSGTSPSKMGIKAVKATEVIFNNVEVPVSNVLGHVGSGIEIALSTTNSGRYGIAALLSGTMRTCIRKATEFSRSHIQFKKTIRSFELTQQKLAHMAMLQYVTEALAYLISSHDDNQVNECYVEASISKCFSTEATWHVCDECLQIMGREGYMTTTGLEKMLRDVRAFRIFEVENDVVRMIIALSGIRYAEMYNTMSGLQKVSQKTVKIMGLGYAPTLEPYVDPSLRDSAKLAGHCIYLLGNAVENILARYGEGIDSRQMILNKLADCAIDIFAMAAVLSRATSSVRRNLASSEYEKILTKCWCLDASERVEANLSCCTSRKKLNNLKNYVLISEIVGDYQGIPQLSPLNF